MKVKSAIQKAVETAFFCVFDDSVVYFWHENRREISDRTLTLFQFERLVTTVNRMSYVFILYGFKTAMLEYGSSNFRL